MYQLKIIKQAMGLPSLAMGASSVLMGGAAASIRGVIEPGIMLLCFFFVGLAQIASNLAFAYNDLRNHYGAPAHHAKPHHRHQEEEDLLVMIREMTVAVAILCITVGIVLASYGGLWTYLLGITVVVLAYINTEGPTPLVQTPFGPLITALLFGPIAVVGTCFLQTHGSDLSLFSWFDAAPPIYLGCSLGFLAANCQLGRYYGDYRVDLTSHRPTFVTLLGRRFSRWVYFLSGFCMWGVFYYTTDTLYFQHPLIDMIIPSVCLVISCIGTRIMSHATGKQKNLYYYLSIANMALLCLGIFILFLAIGAPDDNVRDFY